VAGRAVGDRVVSTVPASRPSPSAYRWSDRRSLLFDLALTGVGLVGVLGMALAPYASSTVLLSLVQITPLAIRRVRPTLSFAIIAGAMAVQVFVKDVPIWGQVALPISVYSMAAYAPRRDARIAFGIALVGGVVGPIDWMRPMLAAQNVTTVVGLLVLTELLVIAPWAIGTLNRTRRAYVAELIDRGHRLEREAATRAELAALDERARIAREMHDVVAHGLSVMIVQADGASYAVRKDPDAAVGAFETISATGRESLAEMRRMLGLLRAEDGLDATGSRPQPGVADLEFLLDQSRGAGMRLTSYVDELGAVGPGVGLTVYRIVQEGLTNVRKHAGPDPAVEVRVFEHAGAVRVRVSDDGRGPDRSASTDEGHGLVGMRERVAVHGGDLRTGPSPGGGFLLEATVPVGEVPA
jgi:signal transduction histidine kinase